MEGSLQGYGILGLVVLMVTKEFLLPALRQMKSRDESNAKQLARQQDELLKRLVELAGDGTGASGLIQSWIAKADILSQQVEADRVQRESALELRLAAFEARCDQRHPEAKQ
jgi:hypothetical protein